MERHRCVKPSCSRLYENNPGSCFDCGSDVRKESDRTAEIIDFAERFAHGDVPANWIAAAPCTLDGALRTIADLRAALAEALTKWGQHSFRSKMIGGPGESVDKARIAELRAKFLGGK